MRTWWIYRDVFGYIWIIPAWNWQTAKPQNAIGPYWTGEEAISLANKWGWVVN
uniref:Uncharacterized protein n=1 Tax=viral metagenome TaxID=1070528 RepID=A0A6M3LP65_9ZZZZ